MRPRLTIDPGAIEHNTRLVRELLEPQAVSLTGVTKACQGDPRVAAAMLAGGATALADSRWESLARLREQFPGAQLQLLRPLPPSDGGVRADLFFVSSASQARRLSNATPNDSLPCCLLVETGDQREGVPLALAGTTADELTSSGDLELVGVATNCACARPDTPAAAALTVLTRVAEQFSGLRGGREPFVVSAGGSGLLRLLNHGRPARDESHFDRITELRCGEALLLGSIPGGSPDLFLTGTRRDAFRLTAPVLEVYEKGGGLQALVALGSQETAGAGVVPQVRSAAVGSVTSDYLTVSIADCSAGGDISEGDHLEFIPTYYALAAAMASPYVERVYAAGQASQGATSTPFQKAT